MSSSTVFVKVRLGLVSEVWPPVSGWTADTDVEGLIAVSEAAESSAAALINGLKRLLETSSMTIRQKPYDLARLL